MTIVKDILRELVRVEGVRTAVVIGRDGFVIEGVTQSETMDNDAIGAVVATGVGSAEIMGHELDVGALRQNIMEYGDGVIVTSLLGTDAILAVVASLKCNLGNVRYQLKKRAEGLRAAL